MLKKKRLLRTAACVISACCVMSMCVFGASAWTNVTEVKLVPDEAYTTRTKAEITERYNQTMLSGFVDQYDNVYADFFSIPRISSSQVSNIGTLSDVQKMAALNALNYYRWLTGMTEIKMNTNTAEGAQQQESAQYASAYLASKNVFSHTPNTSNAIANQAAAASCLSKNTSFTGSPFAADIRDFMDDTADVSGSQLGHRFYLMNPKASSASFGYAKSADAYYGVTELFTSNSIVNNNQPFYAWPSPGYFPIDMVDVNAKWSVMLNHITQAESGVKVSVNGSAVAAAYDQNNQAVIFNAPSGITDGKAFQVVVTGLINELNEAVTIEYTVNCFSMQGALNPAIQYDPATQTVYGLKCGTEIAMLSSYVWNDDTVTVAGKSGTDIIATGDTIQALNGDKQYHVIVRGDLNQDGYCDAIDLLQVKQTVVGLSSLNGDAALAADFDRSGAVESNDYLSVRLLSLGK